MKQTLILVLCNIYLSILVAQTNYAIEIVHQDVNTSLRGLCVVNDSVIWTSGSNGYVGRSIDAGKTWDFKQIHPFDSAEFRDIEAFDANTAVVMSSVQPACILKTTDGGKTWKEVFRNDDPAIFLDAFDFEGDKGICLGDPINNWFYLLSTDNKGDSWKEIKNKKNVAPDSTYAFAASGSTIQIVDENDIYFATGGRSALIYKSQNWGKSWEALTTPMLSGKQSQGIFSIDFPEKEIVLIGGGDYINTNSTNFNFYSGEINLHLGESEDLPDSINWENHGPNPSGYISCIKFLQYPMMSIMCGTGGVDIFNFISEEGGKINEESFNVIGIAPNEKAVYFAGNNGKIGKFIRK